jgi:hypothetical protein
MWGEDFNHVNAEKTFHLMNLMMKNIEKEQESRLKIGLSFN